MRDDVMDHPATELLLRVNGIECYFNISAKNAFIASHERRSALAL